MLLVEQKLVPTRTKAQSLILAGRVLVDGLPVLKVGTVIPSDKKISLESGPKYVSRGGEKLEGALDEFQLSPEGLVCLDLGASTGGFTDCLLQRGALKVYAVDVGHGQIDQSLRTNFKVVNWEKTHVLSLTKTAFAEDIQFVVMDMSFISLRSVLAHVRTLLGGGVTVIPMVKPQFEVGAKNLKKGVVKSEAIAQAAVEDIIAFAKKEGFLYLNQTPAKIKGPKGNQEYFLYLKTL